MSHELKSSLCCHRHVPQRSATLGCCRSAFSRRVPAVPRLLVNRPQCFSPHRKFCSPRSPCWQLQKCKGASQDGDNGSRRFDGLDSNQLQTALNNAIKSEDYALAAALRNQYRETEGTADNLVLDWRAFGCPPWLAERAEQLGYRFPTGAFPFLYLAIWLAPSGTLLSAFRLNKKIRHYDGS